jgi:putative CocE/NonD family hydrolase
LIALSLTCGHIYSQEKEQISKFGEYKGYSQEVYDSWVRRSLYLTMRDGVRLAADVILPAKNGEIAQEALPAIWSHNRYRRATIRNGVVRSTADSPLSQTMLKHGYVLVNVDVRGSGASFGSWDGIFTKEETKDAYEITEWIASQPWCDGNVGMAGGSYLGITQLMAASTHPPHLKAIFPVVALFDIYPVQYPGGVFFDDFIRAWSFLTKFLDLQPGVVPVDEDEDELLLKQAIAEHSSNRALIDIFTPLKFRDSKDDYTGAFPYKEWHPAGFIKEISQSGVPMYLFCGWFDSFTRDGFLMYRNFDVPKKIAMGAWSHSPRDPDIQKEELSILLTERHRWFDYWLKGVDNGIMDEPPIYYHVMNAHKDNEWRSAKEWPLEEEQRIKYYFHEGTSQSVTSVNDGLLDVELPEGPAGEDKYTIDYSTTTGKTTRWDNAVGGGFGYPDMTPNDRKALTYTTKALDRDVEITGHPEVHLWISSTAKDGDFFAYLEEVDAEGVSHYISEGALKASHRALHDPPYDKLGLPFHRSYEEDVVDLVPGERTELQFDLHPTSNVFNTGHRIRLTITCADKDNAETPELSPPPTVTIYRNRKHPSYVILPVIEADEKLIVGVEYSFLLIVLTVFVVIGLVVVLAIYVKKKISQDTSADR